LTAKQIVSGKKVLFYSVGPW